jgi:hypothetical protein
LCIIIEGINEDDLNDKAKNIMKNIETGLTENRLKMNINKTKYMVIKAVNRQCNEGNISIMYNNQKIENVETYKYLGINNDNKLTWGEHKTKIYSKIRSFIPAVYELNETV